MAFTIPNEAAAHNRSQSEIDSEDINTLTRAFNGVYFRAESELKVTATTGLE